MKRIKFWCVAIVLVTATMLLGMPQNAKAAANPPKVIETRVGPNQCVAIPGVTKVRVRQLDPSKKEIDYKVYWNGNERATYEYCYYYGGGDQYTLSPGETQTHTPSFPAGRRVEITNLNYVSPDYSDVLVVEDLTAFENASDEYPGSDDTVQDDACSGQGTVQIPFNLSYPIEFHQGLFSITNNIPNPFQGAKIISGSQTTISADECLNTTEFTISVYENEQQVATISSIPCNSTYELQTDICIPLSPGLNEYKVELTTPDKINGAGQIDNEGPFQLYPADELSIVR